MEGSLVAYKVFSNGSVLNASEINDNLMNQSIAVFSNAAARTAAITSPLEGQMTYLEDTKQVFIYSGSAWQVISTSATSAYSFVQTLYFTSSGSFTKATYPWLRAIRVKTVGGGAGGAGCATTGAGQVAVGGAGGGAATAESFITDIGSLAGTVTVTVGAGGSGGIGSANGNDGGESSFGNGLAYEVSALGGNSGSSLAAGAVPRQTGNSGTTQTTGVGDLVLPGSTSLPRILMTDSATVVVRPNGGSSSIGFGSIGASSSSGIDGGSGSNYGAGGTGGMNAQNQGTARDGGSGSNGIVIIELYA
jgi:hypothetical protein